MSQAAKTETFREAIKRYNALPLSRRLAGYGGIFGGVVCVIGGFVAYQRGVGFVVYLVLAFFLSLFGEHYRYAFTENLSQREVRRIDYWYLSAATIGLFLAAFGYSTQREATMIKIYEKIYETVEPSMVASVREEIDRTSKFLCVDLERATEACAGLKKIAPEIRAGRSPEEVASISEELEQKVIVPYARLFPKEELSKDPNVLLPVTTLQIDIEEWRQYVELVQKAESSSKTDDETEIVIGVGQWVIWPFLLAYALALRITKVTIDVFEWAT